ncbi:DNA polymerase IV [Paenibacillus urinalis]|uniref:DNA polymerase IV n=1 Tax=Paenibacillus urinalis TaxID=521520 RepID=A0ABY7X5L9_9BACL|nr:MULTISPECIES: DNA polymerase IV [Paenibacillus]WDH97463.1 DNA polymerase IV [Paenibacillus urinalis]WDI01130.1 DNA polymerase IV [Paenibacillus urinalis]GAK39816.1 DNA polymerase IV [Paenibacillus sp. TCA20]
MERMKRVIMLADCQSFYASVEKSAHPEYANRPLVVAGDPARRSGIILAACPIAKSYGITTAERLSDALAKCPDVVVVRPRMSEYIRVSLHITDILQSYTDLVEPYSIDEQFLDVTGSLGLFGSPEDIALRIQQQIMQETGVYVRLGISDTKVVSKMACDLFAKKNKNGIYVLPKEQIADTLWPMPIRDMFMVGSRMSRHFYKMGIHTIGDLARTPLPRLRDRWGVNGEVLWRIANGVDQSPVMPSTFHQQQKGIGHQMTLPRDYTTWSEIQVVLLELCELVARRSREKSLMGSVVSVGCRGIDFDKPTGFSRQMKIEEPTHITDEVYEAAKTLFLRHWDGEPVRRIGVSLTDLVPDTEYQLTWFDEREQKRELEKATDEIKRRFGDTAIMRASSLQKAGQAHDRSRKIGGHYR